MYILKSDFSACGVSRSVTLTLAYLLVLTELSLKDLLKAVQGARSCANPNSGFMVIYDLYLNYYFTFLIIWFF